MPINTRISQVERFLKTSQFTINKNGKKKKKKELFCNVRGCVLEGNVSLGVQMCVRGTG